MSKIKIAVRAARHEDFADVARLIGDLVRLTHGWDGDFRPHPLGFTAAMFASRLATPDRLYIVATRQHAITGYASASLERHQGSDWMFPRTDVWVGVLVVDASARRQGVGRALFVRIEEWAAAHHAEAINLTVIANNRPARAFYRAMGYEPTVETRRKRLRTVVRLDAAR